ncbi:hypothetical protein L2D08_14820 [Domibacillus sp. PGB-M46]|uniref:hypothetical protein n=1 Tax=Domibacillus sp. PGB-M46 TaxID=2910255 RepID=UPI001F5782B7|nr:hypothetical protein [Domibacillus sp. PGB-M46]MCI2255643.1 hypothetical protein [Domibacillus sp. PGB-M46]
MWIAEGRGSRAEASLDYPEVTCIIPGFKNTRQVEQNLRAPHTPSFTQEEQERVKAFYDEKVKQHIRGVY